MKGYNMSYEIDSKPQIEITGDIDYLRFTVSFDEISDPLQLIPPEIRESTILKDYGMYGYNRMLQAKNGYAVLWHSEHNTQKYCVQLSGATINDMKAVGYHPQSLVELANMAGKVTRLDYCMDIRNNYAANPIHVYEDYMAGTLKTKSRGTYSYTESGNRKESARTFYDGSRNSPRFLRVYDKAKQLNLLNEAWLRVELEIKKDRAPVVARKMATQGILLTGQAELNDYIKETSVGWLSDALASLAIGDTAITPRKTTDIDLWFHKQVIPCITNRGNEISASVLQKLIAQATFALSAKTLMKEEQN